MIRILQWGTKRSLCKVYDLDEAGEFQPHKLLLINNETLVNYEELGTTVIHVDRL